VLQVPGSAHRVEKPCLALIGDDNSDSAHTTLLVPAALDYPCPPLHYLYAIVPMTAQTMPCKLSSPAPLEMLR
jgi:hypothetical protein